MKKYYIIFISILLPIFVFPQLTTKHSSSTQHKKNNDSNTTRYYQILDGLNKNYVLWYRMRQTFVDMMMVIAKLKFFIPCEYYQN
jgi:hypothetical protein